MPTAVKISDDLVKKAKIRSRVFKRSIAGQIEYWAKIGEIVEFKRQQRRYQARAEAQEAKLSYLIKETEALERDPDKLESLAREKLGLTRKNEKIFIFKPTPVRVESSRENE